uniref:Uncharacterized protein n=1 Tax=Oryza glumipatula TaxID=40148 RepID=A0A0D9Z7T3_9ORYZ
MRSSEGAAAPSSPRTATAAPSSPRPATSAPSSSGMKTAGPRTKTATPPSRRAATTAARKKGLREEGEQDNEEESGIEADRNTIAISPISIVGKPSAKPRIILLFPKTNLSGTPLPIVTVKQKMGSRHPHQTE